MISGIKSWLNISPGVASSPQCVTRAYEIHSQGVRIIMLGDHGRDLSCSLYFWGPKLRSHTTRLLLQQHPVTGGRVGTVVVASYGRMRHLLMSHVEVFAHNSWASALFSQPLLRPVFDLQMLDPFERHIA